MHACGHDGILSTALVLAKLCADHADILSVNVKFIFQPAEENGKGTAMMLSAGVMEDPKVDYFVMFHYVNDAPAGMELQRGTSSATIGSIQLCLHGKASHWCTRELGVDSIGAAGKVLGLIDQLNDTYQTDSPFVLGIGTISGGTAKNIIAEETSMEGTLRACKKEDYFRLREILLSKLAEVEEATGVTIEANIESDPIPPIVNDAALVDLGNEVGMEVWGENCRVISKHFLSGDSASYYFDHARGIFFIFTAAKPGEENYPLHNGKFDFDEAVMEKAAVFLFEFLNRLPGIDR